MAETKYTKYPVKKLDNTYYQLVQTKSFLSNKIEHSFYVNGKKINIGNYSPEKMLYWTSFVEFLNQNCFTSSLYFTEAFNRPIVQWFIELIDGYTLSDISTIMSFKFKHCSPEPYKQIEGISYVEYVSIMPNNRKHCDVLANMKTKYDSVINAYIFINGNKYREISGDDFRAIIAIVQLSFLCFLPQMINSLFFTFHNHQSIIGFAKRKQWLY